MERPTCETCPYCVCIGCNHTPIPDTHCCIDEHGEEVHDELRCHRYPPTKTDELDDEPYAVWQLVEADDWCGEHPDFPAYLASLKGPVTSGESRI